MVRIVERRVGFCCYYYITFPEFVNRQKQKV